jgi:hypothetical protein
MVRYSEDEELHDTKPHRVPEYGNKPLPGKPVSDPAPVDSQSDTIASTAVLQPSARRRYAASEDTQPTIEASGEERLTALSEALTESPENPEARRAMYLVMYRYLQHFPFLRYLEENDLLYQVITSGGRVIRVPKDRAVAVPYPPKPTTLLQRSYRWLGYALLGLLLAGLGAVIFAPIAASFAWRAAREAQNVDYRNRAGMALVYAVSLWGIGLLFGFLFLLHL